MVVVTRCDWGGFYPVFRKCHAHFLFPVVPSPSSHNANCTQQYLRAVPFTNISAKPFFQTTEPIYLLKLQPPPPPFPHVTKWTAPLLRLHPLLHSQPYPCPPFVIITVITVVIIITITLVMQSHYSPLWVNVLWSRLLFVIWECSGSTIITEIP